MIRRDQYWIRLASFFCFFFPFCFGTEQEGYLSWCGTLPPYYKTRVAAETLIKATRAGHLVIVQIANQGDVGFQCSRLTDAIVLEVGLNGVIRACGQE